MTDCTARTEQTAISFIPQVREELSKVERMYHTTWPHMAVDSRWPLNGAINLICAGASQTVEDEIGRELGRVLRIVRG